MGDGGGGATNPPRRRQCPLSAAIAVAVINPPPPTSSEILACPLVFRRNHSSCNRISPAVQTHLGPLHLLSIATATGFVRLPRTANIAILT